MNLNKLKLRLDKYGFLKRDNIGRASFSAVNTDSIHFIVKPHPANAHFNLANILTADSKFSKAILHYKEALKTGDGRAEIHHNLGTLLIKLSKKEEAIQSFRNALQKNPDFIPSQHALANLTKP